MSAAVNLSAADLVRALPVEFREAVFAELLRDHATAADRAYFSLDPVMRADLMRPYAELIPTDGLSDEEVQRRMNAGPDELLTLEEMNELLDRRAAVRG